MLPHLVAEVKKEIQENKIYLKSLITSIERELSKDIPMMDYIIEKTDKINSTSQRICDLKRSLLKK